MSIAHPPETVPYQTYVRIQRERDYWKDRCTKAEQERNQERARQQQRRQLLKSPFKSTEKLVIEEMQRQIDNPNATRDQDGYTRICYKTAGIALGTDEKTPKRTIAAIIEQCPEFPIEAKTVEEPRPDGERGTIKRLYIKPTTQQSLLTAAASVEKLEHKREQGGNQYQCQKCLSHHVMIKRRLHCLDCGHETDLEPTFPNGKLKGAETAKSVLPIRTNLSTDLHDADRAQNVDVDIFPSPEKNLSDDGQLVDVVIQPVTPPTMDSVSEVPAGDEQMSDEEKASIIAEGAALLLQIAGEGETHIVMPKRHPKKYLEVKRPLTLDDLIEHLQGKEPRGASLRYQDGSAYVLMFDSDDFHEWDEWRQVARQLVACGYQVILEESPAGRGGHLVIIYSERVNAVAARAAVLQIAPALETCTEYWPGQGAKGNRVRLPGGYYARLGSHVDQPVEAWCKMLNVATGESSNDGVSAASLLLASITPAHVVPAPLLVENMPQDGPEAAAPIVETLEETAAPSLAAQVIEDVESVSAGAGSVKLPQVDAKWETRYGKVEETTCYFAIMPDIAAAWFNERTPLDSIRSRERNGMVKSPHGEERTASTGYHETDQGERWTDFSGHGRRADGTHESGDALELAARVAGVAKSAFLGGVIRDMIKVGTVDLESAARAGQPIPAWVEEPCILTPAGRRRYENVLVKRGQYGERRHPDQLGGGGDDLPDGPGVGACLSTPARNEDSAAGRDDQSLVMGDRPAGREFTADGSGELRSPIGGADRATESDGSAPAAPVEAHCEAEPQPPAASVVATVHHVGYTEPGARERVDALLADPHAILIDTRYRSYSKLPGWNMQELQARYQGQYKPLGSLLGNRNYKGGPIDILDLSQGIGELEKVIQAGFTPILLCKCRSKTCHRFTILEALLAHLPALEVCPPLQVELVELVEPVEIPAHVQVGDLVPAAPVVSVPDPRCQLREGTRVQTPVGFATITSVTLCPILKRWRCSVRTEKKRADGSRFAAFDVTEVQPFHQGSMF